LLASLYLVCHSRGFSDQEIQEVLRVCIESYVKQVYEFYRQANDHFALTLKNTKGKIKRLLNETRVKSHVAHLDTMTNIENYDRRFKRNKYCKDVDESTDAMVRSVRDIVLSDRVEL
jgi:DNA repair photolyase